jgi:hypothetical protein
MRQITQERADTIIKEAIDAFGEASVKNIDQIYLRVISCCGKDYMTTMKALKEKFGADGELVIAAFLAGLAITNPVQVEPDKAYNSDQPYVW